MAEIQQLPTLPLRRAKGDTFPIVFTWDNDGAPWDLTAEGFTSVLMTGRSDEDGEAEGSSQIFQLTAVVSGSNNEITTFTPGASDLDQAKGTYWFDIVGIKGGLPQWISKLSPLEIFIPMYQG